MADIIDKFELVEYQLQKSNEMVHGKYRASDLEYDLMNIALTRIQKTVVDGREKLIAKLYPNDVNKLVNKGKNIYRDLKTVSSTLPGHTMVLEKRDHKGFVAFSIMPIVDYTDNVLTIEFSEVLRPHLYGLTDSGRFETQNIAITAMLKGYAKRLYEILHSHEYHLKSFNEVFHVTYRVSELKFMLGVANMDETNVKKKIQSFKDGEPIDYDYLYDKVVLEKMYERWDSFSNQVLKKAKKEMDEKADITFEYKGLREGHEVKKVEFIIRRNKPQVQWESYLADTKRAIDENASEAYKQITMFMNNYPRLAEFINHNKLTEDDLTILLADAGNDEDLVISSIGYADQRSHTRNYMGYIRNVIKQKINGTFSEPVEVMNGSHEDAVQYRKDEADYNSVEGQEKRWKFVKEHQADFEDFAAQSPISIDEMELTMPPQDRIQCYIEWHKKNMQDM